MVRTDRLRYADSLTVGEVGATEVEGEEAICGEDDRITAQDAAVGRIRPVGCTGWLIANGAILTAGHCTNGGAGTRMRILEFNVPPSREDGSLRVAAVEDQYPIDTSSIEHGLGVGNDWAVFRALPNSQTGLLPAQRAKPLPRRRKARWSTSLPAPIRSPACWCQSR